MCEWPSTSPGVSVVPGKSMTLAPAAVVADSGPTASMRSPFTRTLQPSCMVSPSHTRAGLRIVMASAAAADWPRWAADGVTIRAAAATARQVFRIPRIIVGPMLTLSESDQAMLAGDRGPAAQLAMSIVVRMAAVYGASELMDVSQAHIDSTIYLGDATLEFAERLASLGARVAVPTSLNVSGVDECGWKDWAVSPEWAAKAARQMLAYERMGATPTWTCAPYQTSARPQFGQQIAW